MDNILIDTDVLLDFFFDRKPFSDNSTELLNHCIENRVNGYVTPVIVANLYYLINKTSTHAKTIESLKNLLSFIDIIQIDKLVIFEALKSNFKDFEDAIQNFATTNYGEIDAIVTRNSKDFKHSKLSILSPETYLKALAK